MMITGKHVDVGDALRGRIEDHLGEIVGRYFENALSANVTVAREAQHFRIDMSVHAARNLVMHGHATADDAYAAYEQAAEKIAKRLRRHKRRLVNRRNDPAGDDGIQARRYVVQDLPEDYEYDETQDTGADEQADTGGLVIAETVEEVPTLSVKDAVLHLDLTGLPAFVFRNRGSGRLNTLYRRTDGNIGWIDPQA